MSLNSLTLRITHPDGSTRESVASQESVILGSGPAAAIRLQDPQVSNLHLMLKVEQNRVTAIDLGSEHGSRLNQARIQTPVSVSSGDTLGLGQSQVKVLFGDGARTGVARPKPFSLDFERSAPPPPASSPALTAPRAVASPPNLRTQGTPGFDLNRPPPSLKRPPATSPPSRSARAGWGGGAAGCSPGASAPAMRPVASPAPRPQERARADQLAWNLVNGPLPHDARPSEQNYALQATMMWGDQLIAVELFADGRPVTLGDAAGNDFTVYHPGTRRHFNLAEGRNGHMLIRLPEGADVTVYAPDGERSLETLESEGRLVRRKTGQAALELSLEERARVTVGSISFLLRFVRPPKSVEVKTMAKDTLFFMVVSGVTTLLALVLVLYWVIVPPAPRSAAQELRDQQQMVRLIMKPKTPPPQPKALKKEKQGAEEGAKAEGEEGKVGKKDAVKEEAEPAKQGTRQVDKRAKDIRRVHSAGLLGAFAKTGAMSNILGNGGLGAGINNALGGLKAGAGVGDARGVGGMGARGTGTGGGGTVGLGIGGLGTKGMGSGAGGYGGIDLGGHAKETTRIIPGKTTVVGGLDKDVIARVIKQHQNEIKYCFEVELQKNPALAGKVAVNFIIEGTGAVSEASVTETSLGNANTEQCMLTKIKRWKFPQPVGGGIVTVNFPWIFKGSGE